MKFMASILVVVSVVGISVVHAYPAEPPISFSSTTPKPLDPNHVPQSACVNMLPVHGNNKPSNAPPPFEVKISANSVKPGEKIKVIVTGKEDHEYLGLYLQGRIGDKPVGEFVQSDNPFIRVSDCKPGSKNAISYISRRVPVKTLTLEWIAPNDVGSEVVFRATIVKTFSEFWVGVLSDKVKITS